MLKMWLAADGRRIATMSAFADAHAALLLVLSAITLHRSGDDSHEGGLTAVFSPTHVWISPWRMRQKLTSLNAWLTPLLLGVAYRRPKGVDRTRQITSEVVVVSASLFSPRSLDAPPL